MKRDKMIIVDLSTRTVTVEPIREDLEKNYMAGEGVGTRLVWEMVEPNISAFEPGNTIVFAAGALNGTVFPAGTVKISVGDCVGEVVIQ